MVDAIRYTKNFVVLFVCLNYSFYIYLVCLSEQCSNHDCNRRTSYFVCGKSFYSKRNFVNIFFTSFLNNATKNCFSILSPSGLTRRELSKKINTYSQRLNQPISLVEYEKKIYSKPKSSRTSKLNMNRAI